MALPSMKEQFAALIAALREHHLLKKRNKSGWESRELLNQYFDTPERDLAKAKVALRLRRDGDEVIQTLKTRGQSVAGLSQRNEYDWKLAKAKLDTKLLDGECWPEELAELDKKTLKPIFTTDFVRERAEISWGRGKAKVVIEAALDLGHVIAGKQKEEICELELELREGEPSALLELAAIQAGSTAGLPFAGSVPPALAWQLVRDHGVLLVDVRSGEERHFVGHVPGALHVAWATGTALTRNTCARKRRTTSSAKPSGPPLTC